ncbi:hypothetical protein G6F24_018984 [Rhizopus arrhizus]|nr:hypothetical protein G6F24_018984 [Rhizopus arrhizus]
MTLDLVRPAERTLTSRSMLLRMSAFSFSMSPSAWPSDLANSPFSSGRTPSATSLTVMVNSAVLPATSTPW